MKSTVASFMAKSTVKAEDFEHRRKIQFNIDKYDAAVKQGKQQFAHLLLAREAAKNSKWRALESLHILLEEFEKNITAHGAKVLWAETAGQALEAIGTICQQYHATTVVKSKSMVTEEIHLNAYLKNKNIESIETDLGEYIQQLDEEPPYHIVTPAMHKSKTDIAKLFEEKLGVPSHLEPEALTQVARQQLRKKFIEAQVGITGANFILPDIGGVAITENEGNARLSMAWPKVHIVIAGIEKVLPTYTDLALFWPLLATYGTGQKLTVYNTIVTGPKQAGEIDGPESMFVILLDNGRTNLLQQPAFREALYCIRCGACLNACPVYKTIGGHAYETTYSGPIGSVITPHLKSLKEYNHLSFASSLCGKCTEVCPVKINLHELLLENRRQAVMEGYSAMPERLMWKAWRKLMLNRKWMNIGKASFKNKLVNKFFTQWVKHRSPVQLAEKSFNEMWKEKRMRS
jgi:L-lactate dehydrogenase complex protein LldF